MSKVYLNSDKYFNDRDCVDDLESMGVDVVPVDYRGGFVSTSKGEDSSLREAQSTIRKRFNLGE